MIRLGKRDLPWAVLVALLVFPGCRIADAQVGLQRKLAGSQPLNYSTAGFSVCQPAPQSDFRIRRYVPGMLSGYLRFDWTLYKDGQEYRYERQVYDLRGNSALNYQNYTFLKDFLALPTEPGTYIGKLEVRRRGVGWGGYNFNQVVISEVSPAMVVGTVTPTPSFTIRNSNGVFVSPPPNGAAIPVSLGGGIIMNASASSCETGYLVIIQESNSAWTRSGQHELDTKWVSGQAPANLDLEQFTTTYSPSDGLGGYFSLMGGNISTGSLASQARYYRIGLQTAGSPGQPLWTLIRVGW